jgi:hypothetical protein
MFTYREMDSPYHEQLLGKGRGRWTLEPPIAETGVRIHPQTSTLRASAHLSSESL